MRMSLFLVLLCGLASCAIILVRVVLAPSEVPANLRPLLSKAKSRSLFVRRFDEEDIKLVLVSRIQLLGTSKQDRERAEKTDEIQRAYNHAVAILRGDV